MATRGLLGLSAVLAWCAATAAACATGQGLGVSAGTGAGTTSTGGSGTGGSGTAGSTIVAEDGGDDGVAPLDGGNFCGDLVHMLQTDAPNLYFVFDISSSMADQAGGGFTKYELVEHSAVEMIESLGPLINVGAAAFPLDVSPQDQCHVGGEVFPVSPGDPISPATGPTTGGFIAATSLEPAGGTPTAATMTALLPGLLQLKGRTVVILSTDGGPNCNPNLMCTKDQCITNIEGMCAGGTTNCCAPGGATGPLECIDHDATVAAIAAIYAAMIPVVVVGVPGSTLYAGMLDDMAVAGGVPQQGSPAYYEIDDLNMLTQTFQTIAASFVSCDYTLTPTPPDMDHTNVYFDGMVVLQDPSNGWVWKSANEIELVGAACTELKTGMVKQIEILSGCPTQKAT